MRHKKLIIIPTALACMYLALFALQLTIVGYVLAVWFAVEYYNDSVCERQNFEKDGDTPDLFYLLVFQEYKYKELIPCLLYGKLTRPHKISAVLCISRDEADAKYQCLGLTRMELILDDGRKENLLERDPLPILYFGEREYARRFSSYNAGRVENAIEEYKEPHRRAYFSSSLWPPTKQATLIAEGKFQCNTGEYLPFRQVSVWKFSRDWGFRKIRPE